MADKDVILNIKVNADKALTAITTYTKKIEENKATQNALKESIKDIEAKMLLLANAQKNGATLTSEQQKELEALTEQYEKQAKELALVEVQTKNNVQTMRSYQKEVQNVIKEQEALASGNEGSLTSLRAQLSNATKEFDNLSRAEREGAKGKEFLDHINALTDEIKEAEEATQRYQRNVGNYKSALERAKKAVGGLRDGVLGFISGGNPMVEMLANTAQQLGSVKKAFSVAGQGAVMLGKQLWALVATPIGAFLTAVAVVVTLFNKGLQSSEERTNRFKVVLAPLQGALDGLANILGTVCDWLLTFVEWQIKAWEAALKFTAALIGQDSAFAEGIKTRQEYINIEKESQELEKKVREEKVLTAQREKDVSVLRAKFAEKDKYTNEERLKFLDQAIAKEKEQAQVNKDIAQKEFELLKRKAALSDNDKEMNDKLAEAEAKVLNTEKALNDKMRELNAQRVEAINAINAEAEAEKKKAQERAKAAAEAAKERAKKEKDALREAEDALNAIIKDNLEKQRAILKTSYDRQIEDLRERLATEKNLTQSARESINVTIEALEARYLQELAQLNKEAVAERLATEREARIAAEDSSIALIKDQYEREQATITASYDRQIAALQERLATENTLTIEAKEALLTQINNLTLQKQSELNASKEQEEIEARALELDTEIELIRAKGLAQLEEDKAIAEAKLEAKREELDAMHQMENESDAEFYLRKLEAQNEYNDLKKDVSDKEVKIDQEKAKKQREAYNSVMQAMSAMGEHSKALGKVAKIMGLAQIAVDTGKAIASGVASASSLPFPANLAAIATTVATVLANMATAMTSIKSAKFATGGLVEGAGSGTSDSIPAMLSNGESVMTAQATSSFAPILSTLNQMGGGVPINVSGIGSQQMGEDMLARAVARGVSELRPVVSVEEINRVSNNVKVIESLATL